MDLEKLHGKLKKLLALSQNNSFEEEADAALQMAQELAQQFNIDLSEVNLDDKSTKELLDIIQAESKEYMFPWLRTLMDALCKLYYTRFLMKDRFLSNGKKSGYTPLVIGTRENIAITLAMFGHFRKSIKAAATKAGYQTEKAERSFCTGAADRIHRRVVQLIESEKKHSNCTALILIRTDRQAAVTQFINNMGDIRKMQSKPSKNFDYDAAWAGDAHGRSVTLSRQSSIEEKS